MTRLDLNPKETEILSQLMERQLAALELEIQHTDHRDFKELLKERRETLQGLIQKVPRPDAVPA